MQSQIQVNNLATKHLCACMCVRVHVHVQVHVYACVYMYVHVCVCVRAYRFDILNSGLTIPIIPIGELESLGEEPVVGADKHREIYITTQLLITAT